MPTRMIRAGWIDSETVSQLTARANRGNGPAAPADRLLGFIAEIAFLRLTLVVDDFGRIDGRIGPLHRKLWPLGEPQDPTELELLEALALLQRPHLATGKRLVSAYEVDGKPYLEIANFGQRLRAMRSKCPEPLTPPQSLDKPRESGNAGQMPDRRPSDDGLKLNRKLNTNTLPVLNNAGSAKPVHKSAGRRVKATYPDPVDNPPAQSETAGNPAPDPIEPEELPEPRPRIAKPAKLERLPDSWQTSSQGIAQAGEFLGMPRMPNEAEAAYLARLTARVRLETA